MIDRSLGAEVRRRKLTYLPPDRIESLYDCVDSVRLHGIPGDFVEFGVALGGSGICLAAALEKNRYLGFDVFGMIPPPSPVDGEAVNERYRVIASGQSRGIGGDPYYGYIDDLYDVVKDAFNSLGCTVDQNRISLVRGLFSETLPRYSGLNIAIAHIDCDWYEPVSYCLEFVWPRLSRGGFIVLDDYNDWEGCRKAANEFISSNEGVEFVRERPHAVLRKA